MAPLQETEISAENRQAANADCDVLVIGGGPGGATIAALLAERGRNVILLEKDQHPRFHIGESLLPQNLPLIDRLGLRQEIEKTSMTKFGIEFVSPFHGKSIQYAFADAYDKRFPYAFQVRRSVFDHILLKNAAAKGATVIENCRATFVDFAAGGNPTITARDAQGATREFRAAFVVDASGRDTLLAAQLGFKRRNPRNSSAAIFGHFTGARRLPGRDEGNISIVWFDNGWFWFIPLADGTTSVGAVCPAAFFKNRGTDLQSFFQTLIASSPEISSRLEHATLAGEVTATGNYSYETTRATGEKFIMIGDACAFIDPVFSSGVLIAMIMGFWGANAIETCLDKPQRAARVLRKYDKAALGVLGGFTWFVYRIREPAMRNLFMSPRNWLRMQEAVLSILAGGILEGWNVRWRLYIFRFFYYVTKLTHLRFHFSRAKQAAS